MTTIHQFNAWDDNDTKFTVQYSHRPAEPMTYTYPGCDEEITVENVDFGHGWERIESHPQLNVDRLTEQAWYDYELQQIMKEAA